MRFASLGGSNAANYAAAGKAVADSAANMHAIQRQTGPDYSQFSKVAMKTAAEQKVAAMKASAKVANAATNAYKGVVEQGHQISVFNKKNEIEIKQKMAGGIAAIGKVAAAGFLSMDKKRDPYPTNTSAKTDLIKSSRAKIDAIDAEEDAYYNSRNATSSTGEGDKPGKVSTGDNPTTGTSTTGTGMSDGWAKWAKVIKAGEGTTGDKGYTTMFTGAQFSDFSKHPELLQRSGRYESDAAGAYQFLSTTWKPAAAKLGITDFTPESQEKVGKYLAQRRGLATDTVFTDKASFLKELDKIAPEWASMPTLATGTSYYGQGGLSPDKAWRIYNEQ